jgi:hypothetical protein
MLTEVERKHLARIPFIAHKSGSRLTFIPIIIAFFTMTTILCLISLVFHSTLPVSQVSTKSDIPPKSDKLTTRIADNLPHASPFMFPYLETLY